MERYHVPVLLAESIEALNIVANGCYADLTLGGGGHARAILEALGPEGRLYCLDRDADALANAPVDARITAIHADYRNLGRWMEYYGVQKLDGVLADLGVSSHHFDEPRRGFTFRDDGPLDMRMNQLGGVTAAEVVQGYPEAKLAGVLRQWGEVERAERVAQAIVQARAKAALATTHQLRDVVLEVYPGTREPHKVLARVFQALRIEVNGELASLEMLLKQLPSLVRQGGRVVVLTYHSLEDRMVKRYLRGDAQRDSKVLEMRDLMGGEAGPFRLLGKAYTPSGDELYRNPRARSAKMRIAERR
jgi:S-adenosyl-methyltransferase mraW